MNNKYAATNKHQSCGNSIQRHSCETSILLDIYGRCIIIFAFNRLLQKQQMVAWQLAKFDQIGMFHST